MRMPMERMNEHAMPRVMPAPTVTPKAKTHTIRSAFLEMFCRERIWRSGRDEQQLD
jgi:hypothetical protein